MYINIEYIIRYIITRRYNCTSGTYAMINWYILVALIAILYRAARDSYSYKVLKVIYEIAVSRMGMDIVRKVLLKQSNPCVYKTVDQVIYSITIKTLIYVRLIVGREEGWGAWKTVKIIIKIYVA